MTELEAKGMPLRLELGAGLEQFIPGVWKLLEADFLEPIHSPVHQLAYIAEGHCLPLTVDDAGFFCGFVPSALRRADSLRDLADVDVFFIVEKGPIEEIQRDVGSVAGFDDGGEPRLEASNARQLVPDLDARKFFVRRGQRVLEVSVKVLDE